MYHYIWWVPTLILACSVSAWLSKNTNEIGGKWLWLCFGFGAIFQLWPFVSKVSTNLLLDAMIYDNIMFLSFAVTLMLLGSGSAFNLVQWSGVALIVIGSILVRI